MRLDQGGRSRALCSAVLGVVVALVFLVVSACVPEEEGRASEVRGLEGSGSDEPPKFPTNGPVPAELLVEGLVFDFTSVPADLNLWVPPGSEARCAAQKIVDDLGADRLSELGFRPGTSGASLNDIDLSVVERDAVVADFMGCVNMTDAVAGLLMGGGRMDAKPALCVAQGLDSKGDLKPFVEAWAFGEAIDPFDQSGQLAEDLLAYSNVCLAATTFYYPGVNLPGDEVIQEQNDANGVSTTVAQPGTSLPALTTPTTP
ncbi:MAG: hypothetical protein ACHQDC_03610 [Acidimicrobiales bacterium]